MTLNIPTASAVDHLDAAAISARLFNLTRLHDSRNDYTYLLLDRHTEHPLKESIEALPDAHSISLPLKDALFKDNPDQSPLLLCLHNQQAAHMQVLEQSITLALEQTSQAGSLRSVCAWIVSAAAPKQLQNSLSEKLLAYWPGSEGIYLRYFDPRVMPSLMRILPPAQQIQLLGKADTWCQLGRDGQWLSYSPAHNADNTPTSVTQRSGTLRPSQAHAQAIDRIELVNITATQLANLGHNMPHSQDATIDAALLAARKLGIQQDEDAIAYAWRAVLHQSLFTAHPALPELIAQSVSSGLRLDTVLEDDMALHHLVSI
jgi:hypothetical protein